MPTEETVRRVQGRVQWFDPGKGFGFVAVACEEHDVLLHANVLRNYGQSSVADGATVDISIQKTPRGYQAVTVHAIEPSKEAFSVPLADIEEMDPEVLHSAELEPGRVKWFDNSKGFGFANVFGRSEDVFIHIEVLRRSSLANLQPGEAIGLRVVDGKRGRIAVEIVAWESSVSS